MNEILCIESLLVGLCLLATAATNVRADDPEVGGQSFEQYLRASAVPPATIERFLRGPSWARFDPELGQWGADGLHVRRQEVPHQHLWR